MIVAVPTESYAGERRVALVPASVPSLTKAGIELIVQSGAGQAAGYPDRLYSDKGARIVGKREEVFAGDAIVQIRAAGANPAAKTADLPLLRSGQTVVAQCHSLNDPQAANAYADKGVSLFALELLPRITRAQSMDVLSSMATVAGYRAVMLAAINVPKMFPMLMTAAGTISPARAFIVGAGVAGLQAISTARRLGALVSAYDVRPAVKEQVLSLGAKFVEMALETGQSETKGGYAQQMDEEFYRKQRELMTRVVAEHDVVITTAAIPGRKAPVLITADMVAGMASGSVIVDLAAEFGGNCELTKPDETVVANGVTILGPTNAPSDVPFHASQMFSKNVCTFLLHLLKDGQLQFNTEDEITRDTLVAREGKIVQPRIVELLAKK